MEPEQTFPIPLADYASFEPAPAEVVVERIAELSARADEKEGEFDELHDQAEAAWKMREKHVEAIMKLGRARRNGKALYMLKGGELVEEKPETKAGPLFDSVTTPEAPATPEEPTMAPLDGHPWGEEPKADGSAYGEALCPDKRVATVRCDAQSGKWTGRIDGLPFAIDLPTAKACVDLIAKEFPDKVLSWQVEYRKADEKPEEPPQEPTAPDAGTEV